MLRIPGAEGTAPTVYNRPTALHLGFRKPRHLNQTAPGNRTKPSSKGLPRGELFEGGWAKIRRGKLWNWSLEMKGKCGIRPLAVASSWMVLLLPSACWMVTVMF